MSDQHPTWPGLLRAKRALHGLTQVDLARQIGVTRQAVQAWESERSCAWPRPEHIRALVSELGITDGELAAIYRGEEEVPA